MDKKMMGGVLAVLGTLTAGVVIDRPAMLSEVTEIAEQVAGNSLAIMYDSRRDIQRRIWDTEDRIKSTGETQALKERLRDLKVQLKDISRQIANAEKGKS